MRTLGFAVLVSVVLVGAGCGGSQTQPTEKLTVSLTPPSDHVHVGDDLKITAKVSDSNGQQLRTGKCKLAWNDSTTGWGQTTNCRGTTERLVTEVGVHDITVTAQGVGGLRAHGFGHLSIFVSS